MHAFDVLGDPVRRRILELVAEGERTSGAICAAIQQEFGISQPAVSQHLKVLREAGLATVRPEGTRRLYAVNFEPLQELDAWLDRFRRFWAPHLEALATKDRTAWTVSDEGKRFMMLSGESWCEAHIASGAGEAEARGMAGRTIAAYTGATGEPSG